MGRPWVSVSCLEFLYWLCYLAVQKRNLCHPQDKFLHNQIQRAVSVFQSYWGTSKNTFSNSGLINACSRNKLSHSNRSHKMEESREIETIVMF